MERLEYRSYAGSIEFSKEDNCFFGKVLGLSKETMISYEGFNANELYEDFKNAIDYYLDHCKKNGEKPQKSYSGTLNIRISSEIHSRIAMIAEKNGTSINAVIRESLEKRLQSAY